MKNFSQIDFYIANFKSLSTQNFFNTFDHKILGYGAFTVVLPLVNNTDKVLIFSCDHLKRLYNYIDNPLLPKYELIEKNIIKENSDDDLLFDVYLADKLKLINLHGGPYYKRTESLYALIDDYVEDDKYLRYEYYETIYLPAIREIDADMHFALCALYNKARLYQEDFFFDIKHDNLMLNKHGTIILNDVIANSDLANISYNLKLWGTR